MKYMDLTKEGTAYIEQAAQLLSAAFPCYREHKVALNEMQSLLAEDSLCIIALDDCDNVAGFIGGLSQYNGHVYELHPLVVGEDLRGQGIGRELVRQLELAAKSRGAITIYIGTDDEENQTSLSGDDLYVDTYTKIRNIQNLRCHPYEFYQKCGYKIVGVVPDANGYGKPDIIMAKRIKDTLD